MLNLLEETRASEKAQCDKREPLDTSIAIL